MSNRLAIFDCDGTLADSGASVCANMDACFVAASLPPPGDATRRIIGLSLFEAMQRLHPAGDEALHRALAEGYRVAARAQRDIGPLHEPLFQGIHEAIVQLDDRGWLLGIATGKSDHGLDLLLRRHGIKQRFVTLQTADRHPSKPHPSMIHQAMADAGAAPASTVMIGDTEFDIAMAKAAGVAAIGVAWGYHDAAELEAAGADFVAHHPSELTGMLEEYW